MFAHILIPLDGSPLAEVVLPYAVAVGRSCRSRLTLLRVLDSNSEATRPRAVDPFEWQIRRAEAEAYLRDKAMMLENAGLQTGFEVREGRSAETVVEFARSAQADLILLSSHGRRGISGWNVSSVVQKIIMRARRSVMIVRAYQPVAAGLEDLCFHRILVPLDGSQRAEVVLPVAAALAHDKDAELLVVHVIEKPHMTHRTPLSVEDIELVNQLTERNRIEAVRYFEELQSRLDVRVQFEVLLGDSADLTLHETVEKEQVDLVILSAHGHSGHVKWPYGSTVVSFIAYGTSPLLIVQDLPHDQIERSRAEVAAEEHGGR